MNKVIIKSINIQNFKGIAKLKISFDDGINKIYASNGRGKTSIKNAWEWILCQNIPDIIPSLNQKELPDLITSVEVTIIVNDLEYILKRESKPKYTKDRETGAKFKSGNESTFSIDGIEVKKENYLSQLSNIIGNGVVGNLPILTNKEFFNTDTTSWKWTDRRKLLMQITGADQQASEIVKKPEYATIKDYILKGFATSDIKSMFEKEKKGYKAEQQKNLILIEQKQSEMNEWLGIDFDRLAQQLSTAKAKLTKLNTASKKENQTEETINISNQIAELTQKLAKLKTQDELDRQTIKNESLNYFKLANEFSSQVTGFKCDAEQNENILAGINDGNICPFCSQKLPQDQIKDLLQRKQECLEERETLRKYIEEATSEFNFYKAKYDESNEKYNNFKQNPQIVRLENQISELKSILDGKKKTELNKMTDENKTALESEISALEREMAKKDLLKKANAQIDMWRLASNEFADQIVDVEVKERALQNFVKEQTDIVNDTVNSFFKNGVSWSLYTMNYNGNLEEDCICMYNRKAYSSLSNGEKNVANLEVIKSLQEAFDTNIVLFSDNAESNTLSYEADQQVIELYAKAGANIKDCIRISDLY